MNVISYFFYKILAILHNFARATVFAAPVFLSIFLRCVSTVILERSKCSAISKLELVFSVNCNISNSLFDSKSLNSFFPC